MGALDITLFRDLRRMWRRRWRCAGDGVRGGDALLAGLGASRSLEETATPITSTAQRRVRLGGARRKAALARFCRHRRVAAVERGIEKPAILDIPGPEPATGVLISLPATGEPSVNACSCARAASGSRPGERGGRSISILPTPTAGIGSTFEAVIGGADDDHRRRHRALPRIRLCSVRRCMMPGQPALRRDLHAEKALAALFDLDGAFDRGEPPAPPRGAAGGGHEAVDRLLAPYGGPGPSPETSFSNAFSRASSTSSGHGRDHPPSPSSSSRPSS